MVSGAKSVSPDSFATASSSRPPHSPGTSFGGRFGYTGSYAAAAHGLEPATVTTDNVLQDPDQHIEGKSLTFHVADDTILVDGQDEKRTQTVFR